MLLTPTPEFSFWRNCEDGDALHRRGIVPLAQGLQMFRIASYGKSTKVRQMARQAIVRWHLGELIGERRGAVG